MIPLFKVNIPPDISKKITKVLQSGYVADGSNVREFEEALGVFIGNKKVTAVHSESNGILLALFMSGARPGDEVIASPVGCVASTMPIHNLFAKVKWCDVKPKTGMMDPSKIQPLITGKTKAILFTHWGGEVGDIVLVKEIAHKYGLKVVEDATESFGAMLDGKHLGNHGSDYTVFSFGPIRHFSTTEGGAIAFTNEDDQVRAKELKRFGIHQPTFRDPLGEISPDSDIPVAGYHFFMNNVCACIGTEHLKNADVILQKYYDNGSFYIQALSGFRGLTMLERNKNAQSSYWVFTFLAERRDDLLNALRSRGVYASKIHMRNDIYSCFGTGIQKELEGVNYFCEHELCIPSGWWVGEEERNTIVEAIRKGW